MALQDDGLHFDINKLLSYNKAFSFAISEREPGKTTSWIRLVYNTFKKTGRPTLVLRRQQVDITDIYIQSIEDTINMWFDDNITFETKNDKTSTLIKLDGKPFLLIVALSSPIGRIKSLVLRGVKYMVFDEFIVNTREKEKYLTNEAFRFKEIYNTFYRCAQEYNYDLKCLFFGNPYSKYNPFFDDFKVPVEKLVRGAIVQGSNWVVWAYEMKPELREDIRNRNPLYEFDDSYTKYAFNGEAVNDRNVRLLSKEPLNFKLQYCFRYHDKYIGIYINCGKPLDYIYWLGYVTDEGKRRSVYCFDFADLCDGTALIQVTDKQKFGTLARAIGKREAQFQDLAINYAMEDIFSRIGGR